MNEAAVTTEDARLKKLVERAKAGDASALDALLRALKDRVYALSLRMLGSVGDAEDATQEILLKLVTHLSSFRGESKLTTWVYRIAANHLMNAQRKRARLPEPTFEIVGGFIEAAVKDSPVQAEGPRSADDVVLAEEMRLTCTQGMLSSLDRDHRLAFALAEILELSSDEGAYVLDITPEAFRKRVSRARERLDEFMRPRCSVYDESAPCRCDRAARTCQKMGLIPEDPQLVQLARHRTSTGARHEPSAAQQQELKGLLDVARVMRTHPDYGAPDALLDELKQMLAAP